MILPGLPTNRNHPKSEAALINLSKEKQFQAAFGFSENRATQCRTVSQNFSLSWQGVSGHLQSEIVLNTSRKPDGTVT